MISGSTFIKGNIVYSAPMSVDETVKNIDIKSNDIKAKIHDVAFILQEEIKKAEERQLSNNLKIEDNQKGEVDIPELIKRFFQNLIGGQILHVGK